MSLAKKQREFIREDISTTLSAGSQLDALKNAHIFLTGGTGFLGSWVLEFVSYLNENSAFNIRVTVPYKKADEFLKDRQHLFNNKAFFFLQCDVRNLGEMPKDTTHIIHAAATTNRNDFCELSCNRIRKQR